MTTFTPRQAVITIYGGDYLDRIRHLERQYDQLTKAVDAAKKREESTARTMDEVPESVELAEQRDALAAEHKALKAEADEKARTDVTVQALPRKVWKALVKAHPPRKAGEDGTEDEALADAAVGVNGEDFPEVLLPGGTIEIGGKQVEYRTIVAPPLADEDLEALSDIDFERLYLTAFGLNRAEVPAPKASLA